MGQLPQTDINAAQSYYAELQVTQEQENQGLQAPQVQPRDNYMSGSQSKNMQNFVNGQEQQQG